MDALIADHGEDGLLELVTTRVAEGERLALIAQTLDLPYSVIWRWLTAESSRMAAYRASLEAKADDEAHRTLEIADSASPDDVAVARLRVDTRLKLASKWDRKRYGEEKDVGGGFSGGIQIVIGSLVTPEAVTPGVVVRDVLTVDQVIAEVDETEVI
jgi:hypothetical protein